MGEIHSKNILICSSKEHKFPPSKHYKSSHKSIPLSEEAFPTIKKPKPKKQRYIFEKDFSIIKPLGSGAYAEVFLVEHKATNTTYALKRIPSKQQDSQFHNEKRILKSVSHPFIVKMHFSFNDDNFLYIAMDHLQNKDIHFHILNNSFFTEDQTRFYLSEVYLAIKYLHSKGIVHRDIKSENIMLSDDGHVRLIDFGSAKKLNCDTQSITDSFIGTAECMSPEVIRRKSYSYEVDWWAFGVLMYEMVYGVVPFRDVYEDGVLEQVLHKEPLYWKWAPCADKGKKRMKVSNEAIDLMKRLLNKVPSNRIKGENIGKHLFFKGVDFEDVESGKVKPPLLSSMVTSVLRVKSVNVS